MKRLRLFVIVAGLCVALAAHAVDPLPFKNRAQEVRFQQLTGQLRCLVCQNESLAASQAKLARQMRHIIFKQMQEGKTDAQIKQYLVDRYSDYVLYKPPLKPSTWALWFGPALILILGAGAVLITVRKRKRTATGEQPTIEHEDW